MILDLAPEVFALLLLVGLMAGFIDSIAGGGGLLAIPALLLAGAPPVTALATNKLQALFGTATAALSYARAGQVDLRSQGAYALVAALGGGAGALMASRLPAEAIRATLPILLIGVALYFGFRKGLNDEDRAQRMGPKAFGATVIPTLGFYDGILGPGTGSFYMLGFVTLRGHGLLKATAHTKLINLASNSGAMAVFAVTVETWWLLGLGMAVTQVLGSRLALRNGARLIRPLLVAVSLALALRLLWQAWLA